MHLHQNIFNKLIISPHVSAIREVLPVEMQRVLQNPQRHWLACTGVAARPLHTVRGTILKTIFKASENDFAVVQMRVLDVSTSGSVEAEAELSPGSSLIVAGKGGLSMFDKGPVIVKGNLSDHPTFGRQLKCIAASHIIDSGGNIAADDRSPDSGGTALPPRTEDMEAFLSSGLFKGVGTKMAQRIVAQLGGDTLDVLNDVDGSFHRLGAVRGVGPSLLSSLKQQWQLRKTSQELITFLQRHGAGVGLAHRCTQVFGSAAAALAVLRGDPYQLALRVPRVGFPTADKLAQSIHGSSHSGTAPARVHAGVVHCLQSALQDGHTCMPLGRVVDSTTKLLGLERVHGEVQHVQDTVQRLVAEGQLVAHVEGGVHGLPDTLLALPWADTAEDAIAVRIQQLKEWNTVWETDAPPTEAWKGGVDPLAGHGVATDAVWSSALRQAIASVQQDTGMQLSSEQVHAVAIALQHPVCVITGGPGTGKTAALRALVETWRLMGRRVALACPTARAAHRVNAAIGIGGGAGGKAAADKAAEGGVKGFAVPPATTLHKLLEYGTASSRPVLSAGGEAGFGGEMGEAEGGAVEPEGGAVRTWSPLDRFGRNKERPLDADACVVDEASMLDVELAAGLFGAVRSMPPGAMSGGAQTGLPRSGMSVVLVGDADQLPSVGAGSVFRDLIDSGSVPVCELRTMFRQAARSSIKQSAAQVNRGEVPRLMTPLDRPEDGDSAPPPPVDEVDGGLVQDCFFVHSASADDVARNVVEVALQHALAAGHPPEDIQVLAPMRRGAAGTDELNKRLQALLNPWHALLMADGEGGVQGGLSEADAAAVASIPPHVRSWLASSVGFCIGDRVMQMSNDYGKGVINGDMGCVTGVSWTGGSIALEGGGLQVHQRGGGGSSATSNDGKRRWWQSSRTPHASALSRGARVTVTFDAASASAGGQVQYTLGEGARYMALAYATTVHKAQGNEWPAVICALHGSHWAMLSRGVLYTALSRAQSAAYVVGTRQAMGIAAKNVAPNERNTLLKLKLQGLQASTAADLQAAGRRLPHSTAPPHQKAYQPAPSGTGPVMHSGEMALQSDLAWALHCAEAAGAGAPPPPPQTHTDIWTQQSLARDKAWRDLNICSALLEDVEEAWVESEEGGGRQPAAPPSTGKIMTAAEASAVLCALEGSRGDTWWGLGLEGALQVGASLGAVLPQHSTSDR